MDQIKIVDLEIYAYHGVAAEEKILGQKFLVSMTINCDTKISGKSDDIKDTINYSKLAHAANDFVKNNSYNLLEALAENLAKHLLLSFNKMNEIEIEIKKPWAPIRLPLKFASVKIKRKWHEVYLALGSNLGDKQKNMDDAVALLQAEQKILVEKVSKFIITEPMGEVEQDDFLNGAVKIKTLLSPLDLLSTINAIEKKLGRTRTIHWGPRTIDIDILLYDDLVTQTETLTIPHYGMHEREFVLKPLCEISPTAFHPLLNQTAYQMLNLLRKS